MAGSVTHWMVAVRLGDDEAAQRLWEHYFGELVRLARRKLKAHRLRPDRDEEDLALSAFNSVCGGLARGRFPRLKDRGDLWRLLVEVTARKVIDHAQHQLRAKRGGGKVVGESDLNFKDRSDLPGGIEQVVGREPTPAFAALVAEELKRLLDALGGNPLRRIAVMKMEGYTDQEVAESLGVDRRTVARKLVIIRKTLDAARGE